MKYILSLVLICGIHLSLLSQHIVEGRILDDVDEALVGATVVFLDSEDSSMVSFAISDNAGAFMLEVDELGSYVMQVSFVAYSSIQVPVEIQEGKSTQLGSFRLAPSSEVLQEVTIKAEHIPMGVIGDTISYNAAAFKTKPGATVEDLLKKLPGVEVGRDGSIKAMGENVQNVLVDGKEFFGDDPKIATKNLEAEAVDKVQVFDKKSEIAEFTGIDDGEEEKTINLKLKEEYKNGGFGNASLSGGTESIYDGKFNYNRFSPKMQAAVILSANNINKQSFSFNEYISFMGGLGNAISNNTADINFGEFGGAAPQGISDNLSSGINFNYDLSEKLQLSSHYLLIDTDQNLERQIIGSQFVDDITFESIDNSLTTRRKNNHRLQAKLEYQPNPYTQVIWNNTLSLISNNDTSLGNTDFIFMGMNTSMTSTNSREIGQQKGIEGNLTLRKKYDKKGRNWINKVRYRYGVASNDNNLQNQIRNASSLFSITQNQFYDFERSGLVYQTTYTEPLSNKTFLSGEYSYEYDIESPRKDFFDVFDEEGVLNDDLSGSYIKKNSILQGVLSLRRNSKRLKMNANLGLQFSSINGRVENQSLVPIENLNNHFVHILPQVKVDYDLTRDDNIELSYRTSVTLPALQELAPLPDNTNPNILVIGNPGLIPAYEHHIGLNYRSIDQFNFKNFFAHLNLTIAEGRVINAVSLDADLIRTVRPINSDRFASLQGYLSHSAPIRPLKIKFNASTRLRWSTYNSFINDQLTQVNETVTSANLIFDNRSKDHVDVAVGVDLSLTSRKYDINDDFNQSFLNYSLFVDGIFYMGDTWSLSSKYDYRSFSGEFFSDARSFHLWSSKVQKSFMNNKWFITLEVNDILNQTQGIERTGSINALYDISFNTRSRYITLGLKVKLGKKKKAGLAF